MEFEVLQLAMRVATQATKIIVAQQGIMLRILKYCAKRVLRMAGALGGHRPPDLFLPDGCMVDPADKRYDRDLTWLSETRLAWLDV